jgi:hypothetical protein
MENQRELDRLASVSRVFMDARILTLRRQNEELRLELFWTKYNTKKLRAAMKHANCGWLGSPECHCWKCSLSGRIDKCTAIDNSKPCQFIPWFESHMTACGLTYEGDPGPHEHEHHACEKKGAVCDIDSHFVETTMRGGFLHKFTYGSKLWKAKSVDNPELKKLEMLFRILNSEKVLGDA